MIIIPADAIETKTGFKILRGKYWTYYRKSFCENCKTTLFECRQNTLKSGGISFCNKACQSIYRHKCIDPVGASILNQKNTPEFVYLLGLIATDGHITYPPNYVHYSCDISLKDLELIDQIKLKFGGRINSDKIFHWRLNNIEFVNYLKNIGFTHNKSYTLNIAEWFHSLPTDLKSHFMRGVFDGDGSICKNKHNLWRISIVSASPSFIQLIQEYFNIGNFIWDKKTCYQYYITNKIDINTFLDKIYDKTTLHLERKYRLYQQFKSEYEQNTRKLYKFASKCKITNKSTR